MCHPSFSSSVCITFMVKARRKVTHLPPSPKCQRGMGVRYLATVWTWSLKFLTFFPSRTGRSDPLYGRLCDCFDQAEVMLWDIPREDTQGHAASAWLSWKGPSPDVSSWNPVAVPGEAQSMERPVQGRHQWRLSAGAQPSADPAQVSATHVGYGFPALAGEASNTVQHRGAVPITPSLSS